jgi:TrmH family RNA methyltransferase
MPIPEPPPITSAQNPRFRAALALREARQRRQQGRILIDGLREIGRALDAGVAPIEAWVDPERLSSAEIDTLVGRLEAAGSAVIVADARLIERLGYGDRSTGIVIVAETPERGLQDLVVGRAALIGVVDAVEKPGNLGAILRSADGAGVSALLVTDPATDIFNPNVIRASLGTVFTVPFAVASTDEAMTWLRSRGLRLVATRVDATIDYTEADLTGPVAVVLGSEVKGLGDAWSGTDVTAVRLPMLGVADSLNVSATAAILFYEALRQRRAGGAR